MLLPPRSSFFVFFLSCVSCLVITRSHSLEVFVEVPGFTVRLKKSDSAIFQSNASSVQLSLSSSDCPGRDAKITVTLDQLCTEEVRLSLLTYSDSLQKWYTVRLMDCDRTLLKFGSQDDFSLFTVEFHHEEDDTSSCQFTEMEFGFTGITRLALISGSVGRSETDDEAMCSAAALAEHQQNGMSPGNGATQGRPSRPSVKCTVRQVTSLQTSFERKLIFAAAIMLCLAALLLLCFFENYRQRAAAAEGRHNRNGYSRNSFTALTFYSPGIPRRGQVDSLSPSLVNATIPALSITCPSQTEIIALPYLNASSGTRGNATPCIPRAVSRNTRHTAGSPLAIVVPRPMVVPAPSDNSRITSTSPVTETTTTTATTTTTTATTTTTTTTTTTAATIRLPSMNEASSTTRDTSVTPRAMQGGDAPPSYDDIQGKGMQVILEESEEEDPPSYWEIKRSKSLQET